MDVDLSPLLTALVGLAAAIVSGATPIVVAVVLRHLKLANQAAVANGLKAALSDAGGIVYQALAATAEKPRDVSIKNRALALGVQHVLAIAPDEVAALGLDNAKITAMVTGELGKLLASDPAATAGPSATAGDIGTGRVPVSAVGHSV